MDELLKRKRRGGHENSSQEDLKCKSRARKSSKRKGFASQGPERGEDKIFSKTAQNFIKSGANLAAIGKICLPWGEDVREVLEARFERGEIFATLQGTSREDVRAVAIGNFDGMHLGHQKLFENLGEHGAIIVVLTGIGSKLTPFAFRSAFTQKKIFYCELSKIKNLSGGEFIELLGQNFINLQKIIVGEDFRFGRDRACGVEFLQREFRGQTCVVGEFCLGGSGVHSSRIKELLSHGQCEAAAELLGRDYEICGRIVRGQGRGAREFVATLNLEPGWFFIPKSGVYATVTSVRGTRYKSVSFVGERLSTDRVFALETHILGDFAGFEAVNSALDRPPCCGGQATDPASNLDEISAHDSAKISTRNFAASESSGAENKNLEAACKNSGAKFACVKFIKFIRENQNFTDLARLKEQILKDVAEAERILQDCEI
nr:riboflavin kinase [uncultured Campylobacter sp.]